MIGMDVIQNDIRDAIEKELCSANERFPLFASLHEAIAVIAEEKEEAGEEMQRVTSSLLDAWCQIRKNEPKTALEHLVRLKFSAEALAIEACQVAAMCEKAAQSAASWRKDES